MLSDHEHDISVLSNLGLIERCNKPNTNTNTNQEKSWQIFREIKGKYYNISAVFFIIINVI